MESFIKSVEVRWSDLDPNFHLRHSVYYDIGAYSRICFFNENGITSEFMAANYFGPIIFREECIFRKEIKLGDSLTIDLRLQKSRADGSRWSFTHNIYKNSDILAAVITLDGAWIDTQKRKLTVPPQQVIEVFQAMPRVEEFEWAK
jgi:acyl-CoA thioester hydrolase